MNRTAWFAAALLGLVLLAGCGERKREVPSDADSARKDVEPPKKEGEAKDVAKKDGEKKDGEKKVEAPKHVPPKPLTPTEKPIELTSVKYGQEYKEDADVTTKKYEKKFLILTGRVTKVGRSPGGEPLLELEGAKDAFLGVQCSTRDKKPWLSALPGQTVKVQGVGPQVAGAASLDQCDVLQVSASPPPTFEADALAKEYGMGGAKAAMKKYGGKPLIVEGEVASVEAKEDEPVLVLLKAAPGPRPYLRFATDSAEGKRAAGLKAGQKVKGVGTFSTDALPQASVGISDVLLIEPAP